METLGAVLTDNQRTEELLRPMTVEEAADFCRVSRQTIYRLTRIKEIPHFKKGNRCLFDKQELLDWLKTGRVCDGKSI